MSHARQVKCWLDVAEYDYAAMQRMIGAGEYAWSIFAGHSAIKNLLRACCGGRAKTRVPRTDDLLRLASAAGLELTADQQDFSAA
jgi:HEPN domain-containing protein